MVGHCLVDDISAGRSARIYQVSQSGFSRRNPVVDVWPPAPGSRQRRYLRRFLHAGAWPIVLPGAASVRAPYGEGGMGLVAARRLEYLPDRWFDLAVGG